LQRQVRELRDTSTKFDMALDAGMTRLEDRVERMERQQSGEHYQEPYQKQYGETETTAPPIMNGRR
jgi:hypothetical protein